MQTTNERNKKVPTIGSSDSEQNLFLFDDDCSDDVKSKRELELSGQEILQKDMWRKKYSTGMNITEKGTTL